MIGLVEDLRDALRQIRRRPIQALVAVTVLAIGLSAGIAAFTYVNAFSQPFPGVASEGLVRLFGVDADDPYMDLPFLDVLDYAESGAFEDLAVAQPFYAASVRLEGLTEVAFIEAVTGDFFPLAGVAASFAIAGLVRGLLHGVEPTDLRTLAGGLAVLLAASVAAAYLPARRASRVDPIRALRPER